jgi:hypothetical protein
VLSTVNRGFYNLCNLKVLEITLSECDTSDWRYNCVEFYKFSAKVVIIDIFFKISLFKCSYLVMMQISDLSENVLFL